MTDHKFTDDEIIEILNAYVERMCGKCNLKGIDICCNTCFIKAISQAADLINRPRAEIKRLYIALEETGGYCPCALFKTDDTKCMCKDFREQIAKGIPGKCHCELYEGVFEK